VLGAVPDSPLVGDGAAPAFPCLPVEVLVIDVHLVQGGKLIVQLLSVVLLLIVVVNRLYDLVLLWLVVHVQLPLDVDVGPQLVIFVRLNPLVVRHHEVVLGPERVHGRVLGRRELHSQVVLEAATHLRMGSFALDALANYHVRLENLPLVFVLGHVVALGCLQH
jgi:hypothetical protein